MLNIKKLASAKFMTIKDNFDLYKNYLLNFKFRLAWLNSSKNLLILHSDDYSKVKVHIPMPSENAEKIYLCRNCQQALNEENLGGWIKTAEGFSPFCKLPTCFPVENGRV